MMHSLPNSTTIISDTRALVNTFIKNAEHRKLSLETIRWYNGYLQPFSIKHPELPMAPEPLEEFIASYPGDERAHGCFRCLRAFYGFACHRYDLANPMDKVRAPVRLNKEKSAISVEQLRTLLECPDIKPWVKTLLYLLADTGCRIGEVVSITRDDVGEDTVKLGSRTGYNRGGKTGERIVPISPVTRQRLLDLPGHTLFPYSVSWLRHSVRKAFNQAGMKGSPHLLRHTFASLFQGSDLALKDILGHHSFYTVNIYRHKKEARAVQEHRQYSPLAMALGNNGDKGAIAPLREGNNSPLLDSASIMLHLAQELGALKERVSNLEQKINNQGGGNGPH